MDPVTTLMLLGWLGGAVGLAVAVWGFRGDRSRGRDRCPACFYEMPGVALPARCSECGLTVERPAQLRRTRRNWQLVRLGVAVILASWVGGAWVPVRKDGWAAALPVLVLKPAAATFRSAAIELEENTFPTTALDRWERMLMARRAADHLLGHPRANAAANHEAIQRAFECASLAGPELKAFAPEFSELAGAAPEPDVRRAGLAMLIRYAPTSAATAHRLREIVARPDAAQVCLEATAELANLAADDPRIGRELLEIMLQSRDEAVVRDAALALVPVEGSRAALPAVRLALANSRDAEVRSDIEFAIRAIESQPP